MVLEEKEGIALLIFKGSDDFFLRFGLLQSAS